MKDLHLKHACYMMTSTYAVGDTVTKLHLSVTIYQTYHK
jgi:hypothetical protein